MQQASWRPCACCPVGIRCLRSTWPLVPQPRQGAWMPTHLKPEVPVITNRAALACPAQGVWGCLHCLIMCHATSRVAAGPYVLILSHDAATSICSVQNARPAATIAWFLLDDVLHCYSVDVKNDQLCDPLLTSIAATSSMCGRCFMWNTGCLTPLRTPQANKHAATNWVSINWVSMARFLSRLVNEHRWQS